MLTSRSCRAILYDRLGEALDEILYQLSQLIISLPPEAKPEVIGSGSRRRIWEALKALGRPGEHG